jgi:hypothetical protein
MAGTRRSTKQYCAAAAAAGGGGGGVDVSSGPFAAALYVYNNFQVPSNNSEVGD